jgi:Mob1/phocein family
MAKQDVFVWLDIRLTYATLKDDGIEINAYPWGSFLVLYQVALPPGESCAAWVAVHAIDFYNDVSTIWAVSKFTCFMWM